ncbi:SDR family NAD(P)-dependent oxidoreductase [Kineococcus indalonis]|uniref:SDR family NAD(P)-dependent oxidoreductase n=1 Tax=Kineococcus indalonis TaxID=2696566 RepID=UPI0014132F85|nr:SDR family NAD(P)-dependent oxidoreductase [Kineococcus indalonis]NAZ85256.1 SDR family NAD(P)-dependent oxidoreductase [Kineococcus indalonis]
MARRVEHAGRTALITGASSGTGAAFARELAARGCDVVLVARREARLRELAAELQDAHGVQAHVVVAGLSRPEAPGAVHAATRDLGVRVDVLVDNAGFGSHGAFAGSEAGRDQEVVVVDVAAPVALAHRFPPAMVARGEGVVVNVSSAAAFQPMPYQVVYAASEAFAQSFSEGLWATTARRASVPSGRRPGWSPRRWKPSTAVRCSRWSGCAGR